MPYAPWLDSDVASATVRNAVTSAAPVALEFDTTVKPLILVVEPVPVEPIVLITLFAFAPVPKLFANAALVVPSVELPAEVSVPVPVVEIEPVVVKLPVFETLHCDAEISLLLEVALMIVIASFGFELLTLTDKK